MFCCPWAGLGWVLVHSTYCQGGIAAERRPHPAPHLPRAGGLVWQCVWPAVTVNSIPTLYNSLVDSVYHLGYGC